MTVTDGGPPMPRWAIWQPLTPGQIATLLVLIIGGSTAYFQSKWDQQATQKIVSQHGDTLALLTTTVGQIATAQALAIVRIDVIEKARADRAVQARADNALVRAQTDQIPVLATRAAALEDASTKVGAALAEISKAVAGLATKVEVLSVKIEELKDDRRSDAGSSPKSAL